MAAITSIPDSKVSELESKLPELEAAMKYSLADAMREGSTVTSQYVGGWVKDEGETMCALSAAMLALRARHMV